MTVTMPAVQIMTSLVLERKMIHGDLMLLLNPSLLYNIAQDIPYHYLISSAYCSSSLQPWGRVEEQVPWRKNAGQRWPLWALQGRHSEHGGQPTDPAAGQVGSATDGHSLGQNGTQGTGHLHGGSTGKISWVSGHVYYTCSLWKALWLVV